MIQNSIDIRHHILTVHQDGFIGTISQSNVQHGTIFSKVDFVPFEHCITTSLDIPWFGKVNEKVKDFLIDTVFRIVNQDLAILRSF